jgi:hypothetical protein
MGHRMEGESMHYSGSRDQFAFEDTLVEVEVLEEILPMEFQVLKVGPFLKGETVKIPRWIAEFFELYNMVSIKDKGELDIAQAMKALWDEKDKPTLQEIDPYFYTKIKKRLTWLRTKLETETNPVLRKELRDLEKTREQIIDQRLTKMLKILGRKTLRSAEEKRLSREEAILYKTLVKQLKDWEEQMNTGEYERGSRSRTKR